MLKEISCNLCGSSEYKIINTCNVTEKDVDIEHLRSKFDLVKCKVCGLIFINPQPVILSEVYSEEYFNKGYMRFYGNTKEGQQTNEPFLYRLDLIEKYKKQGQMLDVGCATGGFLELAKQNGWYAKGVEISEFAQNIALKKGIDVFRGRLEGAKFPANYFNVVSASDILEHSDNPVNFLKEIQRILKIGGILYLAMPNAGSFYYKFFGLISRFNHKNYFVLPHHLYHFSSVTLKKALEKTGFDLVELKFSHSRNSSWWMSLFNFRDRIIAIAKKK